MKLSPVSPTAIMNMNTERVAMIINVQRADIVLSQMGALPTGADATRFGSGLRVRNRSWSMILITTALIPSERIGNALVSASALGTKRPADKLTILV
jgi:hypothetical protein